MSQGFVECISKVYASTAYTRCPMQRVVEHLKDLVKQPLRRLLRIGGDFPVDLIDKLASIDQISL